MTKTQITSTDSAHSSLCSDLSSQTSIHPYCTAARQDPTGWNNHLPGPAPVCCTQQESRCIVNSETQRGFISKSLKTLPAILRASLSFKPNVYLNNKRALEYSPAFSFLWCGGLLNSRPGKHGHSPSHFNVIAFPDRQLWNSSLHCKRSPKTRLIRAWGAFDSPKGVQLHLESEELARVCKWTSVYSAYRVFSPIRSFTFVTWCCTVTYNQAVVFSKCKHCQTGLTLSYRPNQCINF